MKTKTAVAAAARKPLEIPTVDLGGPQAAVVAGTRPFQLVTGRVAVVHS